MSYITINTYDKRSPYRYVGRYHESYTRTVLVEKYYHHKVNLYNNFNLRMNSVLELIRKKQESLDAKIDPSIKVPKWTIPSSVKKVLEQELKCEVHPVGGEYLIVWNEGAEI